MSGIHGKGNRHLLIQPDAYQQLKGGKGDHPGQATPKEGDSENCSSRDVEAGNAGMGPAGLMQALEQMQAMGLKHLLPCKQSPRNAQAGIAQKGGGNK